MPPENQKPQTREHKKNSEISRSNFVGKHLLINTHHLKPNDWHLLISTNELNVLSDNERTQLFVTVPEGDAEVYEGLIHKGYSFNFCYLMRSARNHNFSAIHISMTNQLDKNYTNYSDEWTWFDPAKMIAGETPPILVDDKFNPPDPPPCDGMEPN